MNKSEKRQPNREGTVNLDEAIITKEDFEKAMKTARQEEGCPSPERDAFLGILRKEKGRPLH
jgi:hypothetical protein